jgi:hypothetical protein
VHVKLIGDVYKSIYHLLYAICRPPLTDVPLDQFTSLRHLQLRARFCDKTNEHFTLELPVTDRETEQYLVYIQMNDSLSTNV